MSLRGKKLLALFVPIVTVLILDQVSKYLIRTTPELQRFDIIEGWLAFNFTRNPGMALGMDWLSTPVISSIAIIATIGILVYVLFNLKHSTTAYLVCMGMVLGGALGNITDRIFMGIIEGYGGILDGHVVDFIHFNLTIGDTPVFPYIFNVADVGISVSIIILILFHKKIIPTEKESLEEASENTFEQDVQPSVTSMGESSFVEEVPEEKEESGDANNEGDTRSF